MATIAEQSTELRMATFRLARRLRAEKSDDALSDGQFAVLAILHLHGSHTLTALADRERVSAPSMTRTVNCLEGKAYLARDADPDDRRKVIVRLTDEGAAVVRSTVMKRDAWLTSRMRELSREQRAILSQAAEIMGGMATR